MGPKKSIRMRIDQIQETFCVRKDLNQDRVLMFMQVMEDGGIIEPIEVSEDSLELVDGRHRLQAHRECGCHEIECVLIAQRPRSELIARAFMANSDAPLPMTAGDILTTMKLLIGEGLIRRQVVQLLESTKYPLPTLRRYYDDAKKQLQEQLLRKAAHAVSEDELTTAQAAEKYKVDLEKLREFLSGKRRKAKAGVSGIKGNLSSQFNSHAHSVSMTLGKLGEKFQDGELTVKQGREILDHAERLMKRSLKMCETKRKRFEMIVKDE